VRGEFAVLVTFTAPATNALALVEVIALQTSDGRRNVPKASVEVRLAVPVAPL
jgi:hypothetical protein